MLQKSDYEVNKFELNIPIIDSFAPNRVLFFFTFLFKSMKSLFKIMTILVIPCLSFFIQGCATIVSGTSDNISISSSPATAKFKITNIKYGAEVLSGYTPSVVNLSRKHEYRVSIELPGYRERTVPITQEFNGWFIANLFCGGILGGAIDAVTGAMWSLEPTSISINMDKAYMENGETRYYAVLHAVDSDGNPRYLRVPMEKKSSSN